jgi:hypothetical protein
VLGRDGEFFVLRFDATEPLEKLLLRLGRMPLPPYIERAADAADRERYQTVFARAAAASWPWERRVCARSRRRLAAARSGRSLATADSLSIPDSSFAWSMRW